MKRTLFIIVILSILTNSALSQTDSSETETLFGREMKIGGYGAFEMRFSQAAGDFAYFTGGRGGVIINRIFSFGGAGYGTRTNHTISADNASAELEFGWGGVYMEYINQPHKLMHLTCSVLIGAGGASFENITKSPGNTEKWYDESSAFFIFEPGIGMEINVWEYMRLEIGASYRLALGVDMPHVDDNDIGGFSANIAFKFGLFQKLIDPNNFVPE